MHYRCLLSVLCFTLSVQSSRKSCAKQPAASVGPGPDDVIPGVNPNDTPAIDDPSGSEPAPTEPDPTYSLTVDPIESQWPSHQGNDSSSVIQGSPVSGFGLNVLKQIINEKPAENVFISPVSIWYCLAMAVYGAKGASLDESLDTMQVGSADDLLNQIELLRQSFGSDNRTSMGNFVLHEADLDVNQDYAQALTEKFGSEIDAVNEITADEINSRVSNQTRGLITEAINESDLQDIVMALINAVYFKADFSHAFDEDATMENQEFDGGKTKVTMMHQTSRFRSYESGQGYRALDLPYKPGSSGANYSAIIVLPDEDKDVNTALEGLQAGFIDIIDGLKNATKDETKVILPKFKFEMDYKTEVVDALKTMGMAQVFNPDVADFSGISDSAGLFIEKITHKTFLSVEEKGTEAAAVTVVGISLMSANSVDEKEFIVDRPFLFLIVDMDASNVLFAGAIHEPSVQ